jgi:hypothetical protein
MAGTIVADNIQAASTSTLVLKNGVANTPPTIQDSGGVEIGTFCRAWVNFDGTGTPAIRASFNVSSITDNGTGDYTVNFTTAMPDADYAVAGSLEYRTCFMTNDGVTPRTTTAVRLKNSGFSGSSVVGPTDKAYVSVAIFR